MSTKGCGYWDKRAGRRFRTGIDLRLLSGASIKQNNQRFMACTLHVPNIDCSKAGVMDSVVSNSSPGFPSPYEVRSVLNHRLYTSVLNAFPGCCGHCLFYWVKILKQIDMWNTLLHMRIGNQMRRNCLGIINGLRWCDVTYHSSAPKGPLYSVHTRGNQCP